MEEKNKKQIRVGVKIMPRKEVLDSQGRTILDTLKNHDYKLENCRVGKFIELEFEEEQDSVALKKAEKITEFILHNDLVESYELTLLS